MTFFVPSANVDDRSSSQVVEGSPVAGSHVVPVNVPPNDMLNGLWLLWRELGVNSAHELCMHTNGKIGSSSYASRSPFKQTDRGECLVIGDLRSCVLLFPMSLSSMS